MVSVAARLSLAALVLAAPGCGLILGFHNAQPVTVFTAPEGASLVVDDIPVEGVTTNKGLVVYLNPKAVHSVKATLPGHYAGSRSIRKSIRTGVVIMDGVFTLGIGALIDYLTGALYMFEESIKINLGEVMANPEPSPTSTSGSSDVATPCSICGEPRGDVTPCPHCGMD